MSTRELIFNFVRKRRKCERSRRREKTQVFNCMESSINLLRCKPNSKEPMTTTILFKDIELKLKSNMRFSKSNMRAKRRRLMINSREFLRLKRSLTS
jgi:hypothetical protein